MSADTKKALLIIILVLFTSRATSLNAQETAGELWRGTFSQKSPFPWQGPMELYIRFDEEEAFPQAIEGVLTWRGLSHAQTKINGTRTRKGIQFKETKCLKGGCSSVVLGGQYSAEYKPNSKTLKGHATLSSKSLEGTFKLNRVD